MGKLKDTMAAHQRLAIALVTGLLLIASTLGILAARSTGHGGHTSSTLTTTVTTGGTSTTFQVSAATATSSMTATTTPQPQSTATGTYGSPSPVPGGSTPTSTQTTPTTASGVTPTAGTTPTGSGSTPTPTVPPAPYDAVAVGPLTPVTIAAAGTIETYVDVKNIGANPWVSGWDFRLACVSGCLGPSNYLPGNDVAPGQQWHYTIQLTEPTPWSVTSADLHYRMEYNGVPFGHDIHLHLTVTLAQPLVTQPAPSCNNPSGVAWRWQNPTSGNTIACTVSALLMRQGGSMIPEATITGIPGAYNPNYFNARVHVHFVSSLASTYAGFDVHENGTNSQCNRIQFDINPVGNWRVIEYVPNTSGGCNTIPHQGTMGGAQDYDLTINVEPGGAFLKVNGIAGLSGGFTVSGGLTGLAVRDTTGSSSQVMFSNFELDNPNITKTATFVVIPA